VRAADIVGAPAFVGVVQESCKAIGTMEYAIVLGDESDVAPITCVLEDTYGATLLFGPPEAGKVIQVDYTLRTEDDANGDPRRALMMMEEVTAPTTAPYQVDLKFAGIDDENPLYTTDMAGNPLASPVYLLVVDLQTGDAYTDADTEVQVFDMMNGKVTFDWGPADMRGHKLRIYYRTLDGHCVQVQKAPQYFVEDRLAGQYPGAEAAAVDYRTYTASPDTGDGNYTVLSFPVSAGGQAVVVDYLYGMSTPYQRAAGELHVIGYNEATDTWTIVLNNPNVQAIVGVQGVSVKVRGWWHTQRGRVQKLDLDTLLTPRSLLG